MSDFSTWVRTSLVFKLIGIGVLVLLLLIPNAMVMGLIRERSNLQDQASSQVASTWGLRQTVRGPIVTVPYVIPASGQQAATQGLAYFLPDKLKINGKSEEKLKKKGIYECVLYSSDLNLEGEITIVPNTELAGYQILWDRAKIVVGISDLTGVSNELAIRWNDSSLSFQPGTNSTTIGNGVSAPLAGVDIGKPYKFSMNMKLKGSSYLGFEPVGKRTDISLTSTWPSPSFTGRFATSANKVSDKGFDAQWQVLDLNRNYPQQWLQGQYEFQNSEVGVELMQTVNDYSRNERTAKYAILVISLTFLIYFFAELLRKLRVHPLHYLLVGLALSLFYVLLLSFSEHIGFNYSYFIASAATIGLISLYTGSVTQSKTFGLQLAGLQTVIFGFIYTVLQMEDFALLVGSVGLFITLAIVMYFTRKVYWGQDAGVDSTD